MTRPGERLRQHASRQRMRCTRSNRRAASCKLNPLTPGDAPTDRNLRPDVSANARSNARGAGSESSDLQIYGSRAALSWPIFCVANRLATDLADNSSRCTQRNDAWHAQFVRRLQELHAEFSHVSEERTKFDCIGRESAAGAARRHGGLARRWAYLETGCRSTGDHK